MHNNYRILALGNEEKMIQYLWKHKIPCIAEIHRRGTHYKVLCQWVL